VIASSSLRPDIFVAEIDNLDFRHFVFEIRNDFLWFVEEYGYELSADFAQAAWNALT
jgi:hypothetical protein